MKLRNIIREGIVYPTLDFKKLILIGIILVIIALPHYIGITLQNQTILQIAPIIAIILLIIIEGYKVEIIKHGTQRDEKVPQISPKNFITGIKSIIISIIYYIIPILLTIATAFLTGLVTKLQNMQHLIQHAAATGTNQVSLTFAQYMDIYNSILLVLLLGAIYIAIFSITANIAQARLAETNSIKSGLNIKKVIEKLLKIGIDKYIAYIIITLIIDIFLIGFMVLMTVAIPYVGIIIDAIFIYPILYFFQNYSIGLIYRTN